MIIKIGKCITPKILSEIKRISYNITKTKKKEINNYIKEKDILKIKTKGDLLNLNIYQKEEEKCHCLNYFTQQEGNHIINFITGEHDITNWRTVYRNLKHKELYLNNEKVSINKLEKKIKCGTLKIIDKLFLITEYRNKIKKLQNNFQT